MKLEPSADIKLATILRRWMDENLRYKFEYSSFGMASILRKDTVLHVSLRAVRHENDHESSLFHIYAGYCTNVYFMLLGREADIPNMDFNIGDPDFFEKFGNAWTKYLAALEKSGYILEKMDSYSIRPIR